MRDNIVPVAQDHNGSETVTWVNIADRLDKLHRAMTEFGSTLDDTDRFFLFRYVHEDFESIQRDVNAYISKV